MKVDDREDTSRFSDNNVPQHENGGDAVVQAQPPVGGPYADSSRGSKFRMRIRRRSGKAVGRSNKAVLVSYTNKIREDRGK